MDPEKEYYNVYSSLVDSVDSLIIANSLKNLESLSEQEVNERYDALQKGYGVDFARQLVHFDLSEPGSSHEKRVSEFLERMVHIRRLVLESQLVTFPVLRSIHQANGVSSTERELVTLVNERDNLSKEILALEAEVDALAEKANNKRKANIGTVADGRVKMQELQDLLDQNMASNSNFKENNQDVSAELADLEYQARASAEKIRLLAGVMLNVITSSGLNWYKDPEARRIVLSCGDYEVDV